MNERAERPLREVAMMAYRDLYLSPFDVFAGRVRGHPSLSCHKLKARDQRVEAFEENGAKRNSVTTVGEVKIKRRVALTNSDSS